MGRMATRGSGIHGWVQQFLRAEPPRSKSLIVTLLGDSIAPRTGRLWLGELIGLLRSFHMNERLVRTSIFRLAEEGWLEAQRHGRKSRYVLTASGLERIENAHRRIYDPPPQRWDGLWTVVILSRAGIDADRRAELRRELEWEGFGTLAPGIGVHPCADRAALIAVLDRLHLRESAIVLEACDLKVVAAMPANALIAECWNLEELAAVYQSFLTRFLPVVPMIQNEIEPQAAFVLQSLLIHAFRRIVLHDPRLPAELLPENWPGHAAYDLCRNIYLRIHLQTQRYFAEHLDEASRQITSRAYYERFGGLRNESSGAFQLN